MLIRKKSQIYTINVIEDQQDERTGGGFVFSNDRSPTLGGHIAPGENAAGVGGIGANGSGRQFCTFVIVLAICAFLAFVLAVTLTMRSRIHRHNGHHRGTKLSQDDGSVAVIAMGTSDQPVSGGDNHSMYPTMSESPPVESRKSNRVTGGIGQRLNGVDAGRPTEEDSKQKQA